jgi:hypothetical protein
VVALGSGVVGDGGDFDLAGADRGDGVAEGVADQDVVDQLAACAVDPGVPLQFGDEGGEMSSGPARRPRLLRLLSVVGDENQRDRAHSEFSRGQSLASRRTDGDAA